MNIIINESFIIYNIYDFRDKIKYICNKYDIPFKLFLSTIVVELDYTINPIFIKIYNINNNLFFSIYTEINQNYILYSSLEEAVNNFNDTLIKYAYNLPNLSFFNKLIIKFKLWLKYKLFNEKSALY